MYDFFHKTKKFLYKKFVKKNINKIIGSGIVIKMFNFFNDYNLQSKIFENDKENRKLEYAKIDSNNDLIENDKENRKKDIFLSCIKDNNYEYCYNKIYK